MKPKNPIDSLVVSVTSGKGGVGKTLTTVNMAFAAQNMGYRVLILDGDLGLANVDIVLGIKAKSNIKDVLDGNASLDSIIVEGPNGIFVIPSGSGIASLAQLSPIQQKILVEQCQGLRKKYDLVLIDTGAGIGDNVINLNQIADEVVVVTTPEPHAMTDAYALIKVLSESTNHFSCNLLVNQSRSPVEALKVLQRISEVASRFLNVKVKSLGSIPTDPEVPLNVLRRKVISGRVLHSVAGQAWNQAMHLILSEAKTKKPESIPKLLSGQEDNIWRYLVEGQSEIRLRKNA